MVVFRNEPEFHWDAERMSLNKKEEVTSYYRRNFFFFSEIPRSQHFILITVVFFMHCVFEYYLSSPIFSTYIVT